jgi:hypothetical protein
MSVTLVSALHFFDMRRILRAQRVSLTIAKYGETSKSRRAKKL